MTLLIAGMLVTAYVLGAMPTTYLLAPARNGEPGPAFALKALDRRAHLIVSLLDAAKGAAAVAWAVALGMPEWGGWAAATAVVGHCYPLWLRFHGGKGVATAAGGFGVLAPGPMLAAGLVWWLTSRSPRSAGVAGLTALVAALTGVLGWGPELARAPLAAAAGLLSWRHRNSLRRLFQGREHPFVMQQSEGRHRGHGRQRV